MIRVGVVGLGQSGWHLHAASLHTFSDYEVVAVCDQSAELRRRAADAFGARVYAAPEELFADSDVELVVVATPNSLHASQAIAALEAGKDVVVEKPMATTLAEAQDMVAAARRTGQLLSVFHNRRWDRDYQMVCALVRRGILGSILTFDSRIYMAGGLWGVWGHYGVPEFRPQWRLEQAYGGGYLADWGPHMVDQCIDLMGELPRSVTATLRGDVWTDEVDDYFSMRLAFPSGPVATLEASNNARIAPPRWYVVGKKATLIAPGEFDKWSQMRIRADIERMVAEILPDLPGEMGSKRRYKSGVDLSDYFYSNLSEALESGHSPAITTEHALNVMVVLDAARRSDAAGETVYLDS